MNIIWWWNLIFNGEIERESENWRVRNPWGPYCLLVVACTVALCQCQFFNQGFANKLSLTSRAVQQPRWPGPPVRPDPTWRPTDESNCPYGLGAGQLILKFGFPGRFRVPWLLTRVNRPARPKIFKKKKHGDGLMGLLSFRKFSFTFSNLSLKSLTQPRCPVRRRWFRFHKPIADVAPSSLHSVLGWVSNSTSLLWSTWNLPLDALICAFWWWVSKKGSIYLLKRLYWSWLVVREGVVVALLV